MNEKTKQFITYLAKNYIPATVTSLMKLAYLIDLISVTKKEGQISNFIYRRYNYGPFDKAIYNCILELVDEKLLLEGIQYTPQADEYIVYRFNEDDEKSSFNKLSMKEKKTIDGVLESLKGLGAKALSEITYKTKPIMAIGAKPDNNKGLNKVLDLNKK